MADFHEGVMMMKYLLKNANVFQDNEVNKKDVLICGGKIVSIGVSISHDGDTNVIDLNKPGDNQILVHGIR